MSLAGQAIATRTWPLADRLLIGVVAYFLALKVFCGFNAAPFGDEA